MATLSKFAKNMRTRAEAVETAGSRLAVIGTKAMVRELVGVTPVDTSEALSNWQVNLGNPSADALPPYVPGDKGSTRGVSAQEAIAAADTELTFKKPGQAIWVSNLVDYIKKLDEGSSAQFPGGFVPRGLVAFRVAVKEAAATILSRK